MHRISQVNHGLNLVLVLKNPLEMPKLLTEIQMQQTAVSLALSELGFVHFARFLPTAGGTALLVITEFDGPLEPYVMDFAIAIGDLFTAMLRFVCDAPPLPVRDHPDEFFSFVKEHSRVQVPCVDLPEEYPLYSAYPGTTVLEILGPRKGLPPPAADRPAADIDLDDVQGNILEGYKAKFARHFVYTVTHAGRARAWIASLSSGTNAASIAITTSARWTVKPETMLNIGLTFNGLAALGVDSTLLALFPRAYVEGPSHPDRARANGDVGDSDPAKWRLGAPGDPAHVMLSLYAFSPYEEQFDGASGGILGLALADNGVRLLSQHDATALDDKRDHFGYREGMGQPRIASVCGNADLDCQPAASPGEFLLGTDYADIFGGPSIGRLPPALAQNGTFGAVRMLSQDVEAFAKVLDSGEALLMSGNVKPSRALVAAKLLGRWPDGEPLALFPDDEALKQAKAADKDTNAFDFAPSYEYPDNIDDHAGRRCPVGAHIRRVNPRTSRTTGVRYSRRLMRRGMPYKLPADGAEKAEVGLFGLFLCASLERQFEFIQQQWLNGDLFTAGVRGTQDPLAGAQTNSSIFQVPGMGAGGTTAELEIPRLVTTRGSLYLFFPGVKALRELDKLTAAAPVRVAAEPSDQKLEAALGIWRHPAASIDIESAEVERMAQAFLAPRSLGDPAERARIAARALPTPFDPKDRSFLANPYPTFSRLRRESPVRYVPEHDAYWVFTYPLVQQLLTDQDRFLKLPPGSAEARGLFTMDPPRHAEVREWMNSAFATATRGMEAIARGVVADSLADIHKLTTPCFDFVDRFARRVPRETFLQVLGVPPTLRPFIDETARTVMMHADRTLDPMQQRIGHKAAMVLLNALKQLMDLAAAFPKLSQGTLLHEIAEITLSTPKLSGNEALMTLMHFTLGGYLSMEFLLCTGTRNLLLGRGTAWKALQADPALLEGAVEEMRRFDPPLGIIDRYAAGTLPFGGVTVPTGARLIGLLGSANHDGVFGADADLFDISRPVGPPVPARLTLGGGIHTCIGLPLQAGVVPIAFEALLKALPDLSLASHAQPPWLSDPYFRSFTRLMVTR